MKLLYIYLQGILLIFTEIGIKRKYHRRGPKDKLAQ